MARFIDDPQVLKRSFTYGRLLLAAAFLLNGLSGLMLSKASKLEFLRCYYIVMERFFGGVDLDPTQQKLEENYVLFNFIFQIIKMLMVALSYLVLMGHKMEVVSLLGAGLVLWDIAFYTNPIA